MAQRRELFHSLACSMPASSNLAEGLPPTHTSPDTTSCRACHAFPRHRKNVTHCVSHVVRLPALCSPRTGHRAAVGGPRASCPTSEVSICALQELCNLTPTHPLTTISPMLHTFCLSGNQDIGQSQHRQSWKHDATRTTFVFREVGPRLQA